MSNWKNEPITEKQKRFIEQMNEFSPYPLPPFKGTTKGEAYVYINRNIDLASASEWAIENGYI